MSHNARKDGFHVKRARVVSCILLLKNDQSGRHVPQPGIRSIKKIAQGVDRVHARDRVITFPALMW